MILPKLRMDLDIMLSPVTDRPGLLIRDRFRYSDTTLIIPPPLIPALLLFDGMRTKLDLQTELAASWETLKSVMRRDICSTRLVKRAFLMTILTPRLSKGDS